MILKLFRLKRRFSIYSMIFIYTPTCSGLNITHESIVSCHCRFYQQESVVPVFDALQICCRRRCRSVGSRPSTTASGISSRATAARRWPSHRNTSRSPYWESLCARASTGASTTTSCSPSTSTAGTCVLSCHVGLYWWTNRPIRRNISRQRVHHNHDKISFILIQSSVHFSGQVEKFRFVYCQTI